MIFAMVARIVCVFVNKFQHVREPDGSKKTSYIIFTNFTLIFELAALLGQITGTRRRLDRSR